MLLPITVLDEPWPSTRRQQTWLPYAALRTVMVHAPLRKTARAAVFRDGRTGEGPRLEL